MTPDDIYRWKFFINAFVINGVDYTADMGIVTSAILDSGTTDLLVTPELYEIIVQEYLVKAGCY